MCASRTINPVCLISVDLPPMLGPVTTRQLLCYRMGTHYGNSDTPTHARTHARTHVHTLPIAHLRVIDISVIRDVIISREGVYHTRVSACLHS